MCCHYWLTESDIENNILALQILMHVELKLK